MTQINETNLAKLVRSYQEAETDRIQVEVKLESKWWGKRIIKNEQAALAAGQLLVVPAENQHFKLYTSENGFQI